MKIVALSLASVAACAHGLPPTGLASDTGDVVDDGTFVVARADGHGGGSERFRITRRRGGGYIEHADLAYDRGGEHRDVSVVIETDDAWRPIGGALGAGGAMHLERAGDALAIRGRDGRQLVASTGRVDLYVDGDSTVAWTPACAVTGDAQLALFTAGYPDRKIHVVSSHDHYEKLDITLVSVDGDARMEMACAGGKLLVAVGGGVLAYRDGYKDLGLYMGRALGPI